MNEKILDLCGIYKSFCIGTVNESRLFESFCLSVGRGEFLSVVGSNGSGKTTMLNMISGSVLPDRGSVILCGKDITVQPEYKRAARIARVFQDPALGTVPGMTVRENLALAKNKGKRYGLTFALGRFCDEESLELIRSLGLGLEDRMDVPVGMLSGGQRQALALVMSTAARVELLLLDEHTAALDPKSAEAVMRLTDKIIREKRITAIMVTHNLRYAVEYGDRIIMMHKGKAVIDRSADEKRALTVKDLLSTFNEISVECGN